MACITQHLEGCCFPPVLPIHAFEAQIVEAVRENQVVIVIGATGSGKTTQLAQFLHRAGFAKEGAIAITQPRRVAAVSVARRVACEMGVPLGGEVGYSVRFEDRVSDATRIKYLTDGCLLRECLQDPQLRRYSVVILDEAHERSLNTDILFGLLKRLARARAPPLRLLVTSATLDGQKFSAFFGACPVLDVPGKMFPVELLHSTERPSSYLESTIETTMGIHRREPEGDVLVFLTGQEEIEKAVRALEERIAHLEEGACMDAVILPLHASLPPELQARVFARPQPGCRRIIVATNVAETSLTVDGIVYVVDPGVVKQRSYNPATGMDALSVVPISRVQAVQRAGRAGRTRPGKCYRLYSESAYEHKLLPATVPEIQRSSLAGAVLYLKSLRLAEVDVLTFDFLDRPSGAALEDALRQLYILDAIDADGRITAVGERMAELPLEPSVARALLAAEELGCLSQALTVAAMLSCDTVFFQPPQGGRKGEPAPPAGREAVGGAFTGDGEGDHIVLLQIYEAWEAAGFDLQWCKDRSLKIRSMQFARDVRRQLQSAMQRRRKEGTSGAGVGGNKEARRSTGQEDKGRPEGGASREPDAERALAEELSDGMGNGGHDQRGPRGESLGLNYTGDLRDDRDHHRRSHRRDRRNEDRNSGPRRGREGETGHGRRGEAGTKRARGAEASEEGRVLRPDAEGGGSAAKGGTAALRHAFCIGFANRLAHRMPRHNAYRTLSDSSKVAQVHPASTALKVDEEGLLPEWLLYQELVATSRPFLRHVCAVEGDWVAPLLPRLHGVDVKRLSGQGAAAEEVELAPTARTGSRAAVAAGSKLSNESDVSAARERFLARKQAKKS